jgi:hypothetical protein
MSNKTERKGPKAYEASFAVPLTRCCWLRPLKASMGYLKILARWTGLAALASRLNQRDAVREGPSKREKMLEEELAAALCRDWKKL